MKIFKTALAIVSAVVFLWALIVFADYGRVVTGNKPFFCISSGGFYRGLGYCYEIYPHPVTGKDEHCFYLFGREIESAFTN